MSRGKNGLAAPGRVPAQLAKPYEAPKGRQKSLVEVRGLPRTSLRDLYPFLLSTSWPRLIGLIILTYLLINAVFAVGYWWDVGGVENVRPGSYVDAFFFSVQTWATIGYGKWVPQSVFAHMLVTIESLAGMLSVAVITGLIFAKFSRPTARVMFSNVALISDWEGQRSLLFRLANARGTNIADAEVSVTLSRMEASGDDFIRKSHELVLTRSRNPVFVYTWLVIHPVREGSPLHGATSESLAKSETTIVVSLSGVDEVYNQTVYIRSVYLPNQIEWNRDFVGILKRTEDGRRMIDYTHFHDTEPSDEPLPPV